MTVRADAAPAARYLPGFQPLLTEYTDLPLTEVEGAIPPELSGTLYRNSAGRLDRFGARYAHWFDGDGMVSAFTFRRGRATFRNRMVQTAWYRREERQRRSLYRGLQTQRPGGWWRNLGRQIKNTANTNVVLHAGKLLALWEAGRPHALLPTSLETMGEEDFDGMLPYETFFSAHVHRDPARGELVAIGPAIGRSPAMKVWVLDPAGRCRLEHTVPTAQTHIMHDFGLTPSSLVLLAAPHYLDLRRLPGHLLGRTPIFDCFRWHGDEPTTIYRVVRATGAIQRYEIPTCFILHVVNTFDDGEDVVLDAVSYPDSGALRLVEDFFAGRPPRDAYPTVVRLRLHPDGTVTRTVHLPVALEFPRIDDRCDASPYTYCYGVAFAPTEIVGSTLVRLNMQEQTTQTIDFGAGCYPGEVVFAPRLHGTAETDGWVLSVVYNSATHRSFVAVIDAADFREPCARIHLPFHHPLGFHGNFYAHA